MLRRTLVEEIAANRRKSFIFSFLMILLLTALTAVIVGMSAPRQWMYGAAGGCILAIICALIARFKGPDIMLALSGARPATHAEDQVLDNVAEEMALAAGIPKPQVYVIDDPSPNAFATGSDPKNGVVVFTTGIIQKLNRDELQGVMAHELSHVRNYDVRYMTTVALMAGLVPILAGVIRNMFWFGGGRRSSDDSDSEGAGIFAIVGLLLAIVGPIFGVLIQLAISRQREFLADASAAQLTRNPEGLANALMKLDADPLPMMSTNVATQPMFIVNPLRDGGSSLFSSHPSTEERVKALMGTMGMYQMQAQASAPPAAPQTTSPPVMPQAMPQTSASPIPPIATPHILPGQPPSFTPIVHSTTPGFEDMPEIPDQHRP